MNSGTRYEANCAKWKEYGGRGDSATNFHLDNYHANSGAMYINYQQQRNIYFGKDYYTLKDLSNGTQKHVVQWSSGSRKIFDFFKKASTGAGEAQIGAIDIMDSIPFI